MKKIPLRILQEEVQSLGVNSTGLKDSEELSEMQALITSLNSALSSLETEVMTVLATVDLLKSDSSIPKSNPSYRNTHSLPESHQTYKALYADVTRQNGGRHGCRRLGMNNGASNLNVRED